MKSKGYRKVSRSKGLGGRQSLNVSAFLTNNNFLFFVFIVNFKKKHVINCRTDNGTYEFGRSFGCIDLGQNIGQFELKSKHRSK